MSNARQEDTQVIIVGGGPVGMGLAIELGQRGIHCVVVERYASPQPIPKGQNLTQRTMEHFYFWGAEKDLRAARTIPRDYGIGGLTAYGTLLGGYTYDWLQRELVRPFYFTDNERLPQYATEAVLRQRAAEIPQVSTLYGWSAEEVNQDSDGVHVVITKRDQDDRRILHARYVVGCDGSRSMVREQSGVTQTRSDHDRLMVLLVFRSKGLHQLLERFPGKSYYNVLDPELKGYWKFFGRVDLGTTWFFHAPVPLGTTKDNFDFRQYLHSAVGAEFDVELEHIGFWDLRVATADTYRRGRIFIAGDAAHSHPPYGGYGINTGLEDAVNLAGSLLPRCKVGPGLGSWTLTTRSEGLSFSRRHGTSSSGPSRLTDNSWTHSVQIATEARLSVNGRPVAPAQRPRSMPLSPTTAAPQLCGETPEVAVVLSVHIASKHGRDITLHLCFSRQVATSLRIWVRAFLSWAWTSMKAP
jgi:2-polyprenyl-6-methoxyphenol hydroxylase-like FAD-dependent oxidoreductase